jgi:hypothetical protein
MIRWWTKSGGEQAKPALDPMALLAFGQDIANQDFDPSDLTIRVGGNIREPFAARGNSMRLDPLQEEILTC